MARISEQKQQKLTDIIFDWLCEVNIARKETCAVHMEVFNNGNGGTLYICTSYPGFMIGRHGNTVHKYKKRIETELDMTIDISFVEMGNAPIRYF